MNYFLALLILGLGCAGYYEYNILHSKNAGDEQRLADLGTRLDTVKAQETKLETDNARLTKAANDGQATITDLTKQLQDAQTALAEEKQKILPPPAALVGSTAGLTPSANNMGTIATLDGKAFPNCELLKVQTDCIVVNFTGGITQIPYTIMPPDLQKRFGFDPQQAVALTADQVAAQEDKRKAAAAQTAGN
jgi:hypothetical protein